MYPERAVIEGLIVPMGTTQNIQLLQEARRCHHPHDAQYFDAPHLALVLSGFSTHPTCGCCGPVCRCARKTSGRSFYFVENGEAAFLQAAQAIASQLGVGGREGLCLTDAGLQVLEEFRIAGGEQNQFGH
jgi:hypothetical protein